MYVATRELQLNDRKASPGDAVPEALKWSYPVLLAHLNMGWLKYVDDGRGVHPDDKQSAATVPKKAAKPKKAKRKPAKKKAVVDPLLSAVVASYAPPETNTKKRVTSSVKK